jgi:glycosyltransferase involved in cell wall biosynthesis
MKEVDRKILAGHDIIYFGPEKWDGMWRNRHQLMSRFGKYNKVLYIEPKYSLRDLRCQLCKGTLGWSHLIRNAKQKRVIKKTNNLNLYIYNTPIFLPVSGRHLLDKATMNVWILWLKMAIQRLGFRKPIIWLSRPNMVNLIGRLNERLVIYHVVDEYLGYGIHSEESKQKLMKLERTMLQRADIVITVSEKLFLSKRKFNKYTYLVPNAVDYNSYDRALQLDMSPPKDLGVLPKPVIGYSGLISTRLDFEIIDYIAVNHPEWSLVLMGGVNKGCNNILQRFQKLKNIHLLGLKPIDKVPHYVKNFDVCIIPYGENEQSENLSPLKLYDYFAIGKPVVTTDFPVARKFQHVIKISNSKKTFLKNIEESLLNESNQFFVERRKIALENTWDHRIEELSKIIQLHEPIKLADKRQA